MLMSFSPGVRPNEENEESRIVTVALFYLLFGLGFGFTFVCLYHSV